MQAPTGVTPTTHNKLSTEKRVSSVGWNRSIPCVAPNDDWSSDGLSPMDRLEQSGRDRTSPDIKSSAIGAESIRNIEPKSFRNRHLRRHVSKGCNRKTPSRFCFEWSRPKLRHFAVPKLFLKKFEKNDQLWWFSLATPIGWGRIQPRRSHEVLGRSKQFALKLIGGSQILRCTRLTGGGEFRQRNSRRRFCRTEEVVRNQSPRRDLGWVAF